MSEAIWRGNRVAVITKGVKRAVIITPCLIKLQVDARELRRAPAAPRPKKDSRRF